MKQLNLIGQKYGNYLYNGIDRKDSSIGYLLENCVSCCSKCNQIKMDMSETDFLSHVTKIYRYSHDK